MRIGIGIASLALLLALCGCAKICEFGQDEGSSGLKCFSVISRIELGMSAKEVEAKIGAPQNKKFDVPYRGKTYDEVWVYNTATPTILYFKNGTLKHKEYQQQELAP